MSGRILVGVDREIQDVPDEKYLEGLENIPSRMASRLAFMSRDHHVVRDFVVREMPRQVEVLEQRHVAPLSPEALRL